ncbi:MAG: branched chain amino acid aminotransferase [Ignavibacteria bacterium RIFCSPLOWO2_12_FULL_56_21]|nr:MAG: branched chain amino acid aminotransferase [Ignavibacteria bacterium GWC2_56_12]OGU65914.1 MAG: branched chain amino acid aminotransferase [Ignavibacteria bacterium RIFCSPHIGHO2_02_FULL_56_12]OGU75782.1 MAG: branched chain amino acid aminotransferase [Ignavibacteria bacterium RIFCSPLOWO2_12_FULL_56_21]
MSMHSRYIWMDGELLPYERATLHFLTPALHYGVGAFEGIRCYSTKEGPAVFRLYDHIERLVQSARVLGFRSLPYSVDDLVDAVRLTVRTNGFTECYIRPLIYLAGGGWNLNIDGGRAAVGIAAWEWTNYLGSEALERGVRANISSFTRHHPNVAMTKAKITGNYANSFLAKTESVRLGFDEAILLEPQGYVAECTGENLFIVKRGRIVTPDLAPVLEGITRDSIVSLAHDRGIEVVEAPVSRDQLYTADEVFVCGTAAECIGLREIDHRVIGTGTMGPITKMLQEEYRAAVHGSHMRSQSWLTYVGEAAAVPARKLARA